jgi:NAD(P)-dependent dehydrogenase (short-subunit alcohol dehydrogenase family)
MGRLDGKVAVITGSTQGVGEGIARRFAREGAIVVGNGRSPDKGERALANLRTLTDQPVRFIRADVSRKEDCQRLIDQTVGEFGRVDVLVNNAQTMMPWQRTEDEGLDESLEVFMRSSLHASLWLSQAVLEPMRLGGGGSIINMGSTSGVLGVRFSAGYNATKEAIRGLTRTQAQEWGHYGITVNVLMPAAVTPGHRRLVAERKRLSEETEEFNEQLRMWDLTDRLQPFVLLDAENGVALTAVGLASDSGRFITGQTIYADGGLHLWGINKHMTMPGQAYHESIDRA